METRTSVTQRTSAAVVPADETASIPPASTATGRPSLSTHSAAADPPSKPSNSSSFSDRELTISSSLLFGVYLILPVVAISVAADVLFFRYSLRDWLPHGHPDEWVWVTLIFSLPHIVASLITYVDGEYVQAYKEPLMKGTLMAISTTIGIPLLLGIDAFILFIAVYMMYHVLMQQYGVSLMLLGARPDGYFAVWKWLSILCSATVFLFIYNLLPTHYIGMDEPTAIRYFTPVVGVVFAISVVCALIFLANVRKTNPKVSALAQAFFVANIFMLALCFVLFMLPGTGYRFWIVVIPQFVHDLTAFAVYMVHDHNRNRPVTGGRKNLIHRACSILSLDPFFVVFPLAISLASWLTLYRWENELVGFVTAVFTLLHYYMEGHMWKRGTLHRQNVRFVV
jgi:hypothetical protein